MKPRVSGGVFSVLAWAPLALVAGAQETGQASPAPGGLVRVDPSQESDDPSNLKGLFARAFDRERWRERLLDSDLDQRERSLDVLLKRARLDPIARAFVEELAADPKGGELAWTARLALRELGRANLPLQGFLGPDPFGSAQRMQEMMEELFARDGVGLMWRHPTRTQAPLALGSRASGRSVQVEQTGNGARVRITETVDGQARTRDFEGSSLQEILAANPELAGELEGLSIRVAPGAPIDLRFDLGSGLDQRLQRFPRLDQGGLRLAPHGRSRPALTDRLGVIVEPVSAATARELGLEDQGLLVESAYAATYAHLLGVKAGDVLLVLNGVVLKKPADIEKVMSARQPDDELTLIWLDELGQRQEKTWRPEPDRR
jgi:hypothetical protein